MDLGVGDVVGRVEHLTLRRTVVRDPQGALVTIPNGEIAQVAVQQCRFERLDLTAAGTSGEDPLCGRVADIGVQQCQLGLPQAANLTGGAERRSDAFEQRVIRLAKA